MTYRFLSPALTELTEAADFMDESDAAIKRILKFPKAWARLSEEYRHCNLRKK